MADYKDADDWINTRQIPWGGTPYDDPEPGKSESLHHSWWANNRASNGAWDVAKQVLGVVTGVASAVAGVVATQAAHTTELVRIRTYAGRIEAAVARIEAKLNETS